MDREAIRQAQVGLPYRVIGSLVIEVSAPAARRAHKDRRRPKAILGNLKRRVAVAVRHDQAAMADKQGDGATGLLFEQASDPFAARSAGPFLKATDDTGD
jgi:hypothetical protein